MALRIGGLASGIDTESLVKELMTVQKLPMNKLTQQKTWTEWQKDSYRDINLALSNLRTLASDMRLQSTFNSYSSITSTTGIVTAETTSNSVNGSYTVNVEKLASGAKMRSANPITTLADPLKRAQSTDAIGVAGQVMVSGLTEPIEIEATMTYAAVAKRIQDFTAGKVPELRVGFDNTTSSFFISTKEMGTNQNFTIGFTNADGTANPNLAKQIINQAAPAGSDPAFETSFSTEDALDESFMTAAANGKITFDGITVDNLTSNKTTINGLTLNLVGIGTSTVTVQADPTKTFDKIKEFVEKYNETIADIEKKLVEKRYPDFQPLSAEQKKDMSEKEIELWEEKARSGLMRNDPILRGAIQELRQSFMKPVEGIAAGHINLLSQIGINTGTWSEGGKLFIDEDKLKDALTKKPDEVRTLFTNRVGDIAVGVGGRVYENLNNVIKKLSDKAGSPTSLVDNSLITMHIRQMDSEIAKWQTRLTKVEDRYWKQFTAMEKALSQMNSQSAWMQQNMFGGM